MPREEEAAASDTGRSRERYLKPEIVTVRMSRDLRREIARLARLDGRGEAEMIRILLWDAVWPDRIRREQAKDLPSARSNA